MFAKATAATFAVLTFTALPAHAQKPAQATARSQTAPVPTPSVARINYKKPQDYAVLSPSMGSPERIRKIAAGLKADTPERTLVAIGKWIETNLRYDDKAAYTWRNCDAVLDSQVYGGCADHALVFAALARACGIPAVFVKTMDADWIREFRTTGTSTSWRGHVFLEVFLNGKWRLLDAQGMQLYDDYDPAMRVLPGNRYAYDKGADPQALLLSLDWERWKQQTAAYFRSFDVTQLPVGAGRNVDASSDVYIAANSPVYEVAAARCRALGLPVRMSFNGDFEKWLAQAKSGYLIVTCVGEGVVLPAQYHQQYLPVSQEELKQKVQTDGQGILRRQLGDGTKVVLVYGKDVNSILNAIKTLELTPKL